MTTSSPSKPLAGRIALVTGATRGIGAAIALGYAEAGAHVIAVGRTQGGLEALDDKIFAATGEHAGFGLRGMEARARLLGGTFAMESNASGTRVVTRLPLTTGG